MAVLKVRIYRDEQKQWRWTLKRDHSRRIIGASTEGYRNRIDVEKNLRLVTGIPATGAEQEDGSFAWLVERK